MISVILPTLNAGERLAATLAPLATQEMPPDVEYEIVVVDNGTSPAMLRQVEELVASVPMARIVHEPRRGVANAKNTAVQSAHGKILAFLDDDVVVPPHWLRVLTAPIIDDAADIVAGAVHIAQHLSHEEFTAYHLNFLSDTCDGLGNPPRTVIGASMACRKEIFEEGIDFPTPFGPGLLGFLEESIWYDRARAAGYRACFVDEAPAEHHFMPSRLTRKAWLRRAKEQGIAEGYYEAQVVGDADRQASLRAVLKGLPRYLRITATDRRADTPSQEHLELRRVMARHVEILRSALPSRAQHSDS